jgi:hypothetical protein
MQAFRWNRPMFPHVDTLTAGQMRPSCRLCGWLSDHLPGRADLRPPRASIARAMSVLIILAGSRRALAQAVRTPGAGRRHTALTHRLHPAG